MIGIFGRKGTDKRACISSYMAELGCTAFSYTIRYGETSHSIREIKQILLDQAASVSITPKIPGSMCEYTNGAIIVERADILAYEPDDHETMRFMLDLHEHAKRAEMLVFLLFDRLITDPDTVMATKKYREILDEQITPRLYMGAIHADFRRQLLQEQFEAHITNNNQCEDRHPIQNALTEGDYLNLVDQHTVGATPQQIRNFVRCVFDNLTSRHPIAYCQPLGAPADSPRLLNMAVVTSHMSTATGNLHILSVDGMTAENVFSVATGNGTPAGKNPHAPPAPFMAESFEPPGKKKRSRIPTQMDEIKMEQEPEKVPGF